MQAQNKKEMCYYSINNSSELENIRTFVINCAESFGFDYKESHKIALAVDEACSNLIKYAFKEDQNKDIEVKIEVKNNVLNVSIYDDAEPFNPLTIPSPDMNEYFKKFKKGGLGIHIMKLVMDEISYKPKSKTNKKNILLLKKQIK